MPESSEITLKVNTTGEVKSLAEFVTETLDKLQANLKQNEAALCRWGDEGGYCPE